MTNVRDALLNESSLSRVWKNTTEHDSGTISAFRYARDCGDGEVYTLQENRKRNAILKAKLLVAGYSVTPIKGTYIENYKSDNEIEVKEDSFLVVDIKDTGDLKKNLMRLGNTFEQDSITYSTKENGDYYIIGTNKCPNSHPGFNVEQKLGKSIYGKKGIFHSKVNNRPFVFESIIGRTDLLTGGYSIAEIRSITHLAKEEV